MELHRFRNKKENTQAVFDAKLATRDEKALLKTHNQVWMNEIEQPISDFKQMQQESAEE